LKFLLRYCYPCAEGLDIRSVACELCPKKFWGHGAFVPTNIDGKWVHKLCSSWMHINELPDVRDNIIDLNFFIEQGYFKDRHLLKCDVCGQSKIGSCIQCSSTRCTVAVHPQCLFNPLCTWQKERTEEGFHEAYCKKHTKKVSTSNKAARGKSKRQQQSTNAPTSRQLDHVTASSAKLSKKVLKKTTIHKRTHFDSSDNEIEADFDTDKEIDISAAIVKPAASTMVHQRKRKRSSSKAAASADSSDDIDDAEFESDRKVVASIKREKQGNKFDFKSLDSNRVEKAISAPIEVLSDEPKSTNYRANRPENDRGSSSTNQPQVIFLHCVLLLSIICVQLLTSITIVGWLRRIWLLLV
jgi:hypothetical protein